jgi:hypothetical protein
MGNTDSSTERNELIKMIEKSGLNHTEQFKMIIDEYSALKAETKPIKKAVKRIII